MTREIDSLMQQGKWDDAIVQIQGVLQLQPTNPRLHAYLGMCYMRKSAFVQAEACFRKAVTLDPEFWEAGVRFAQCLDRLLKYKEALQVAEKYLHMRPNDPTLKALVNGLRRQQGAVEEESWQKSVKGGWHNVMLSQE